MTSSAAPRRRTLPALLAAAALAAAAVFASAAPASAHDELVSSDPAAGAVLDAAPSSVTLTYSAEILAEEGATQVQVTDEAGTTLSEAAPVVSGTEVTQELSGAASGTVTVLWRVVSSDGHPISGEFTFTVPAAAPTATPTSTAPTPEASATSEAPTSAASETPEVTTTEAAPASDASPLPWIIGIVALLLVAGALVWLFVSRGRRNGTGGGSTGTLGR